MPYPQLVVEAGFGFDPMDTVTAWTDITNKVRRVDWVRGRQFQMDRVEAGSGSVTLDNNTGDFTPGNTAGAYTPDIDIGVPIRISAVYATVTYRLFYGLWEDVPVQFPDLTDALVEVPFADMFSLLSRADVPDGFEVAVLNLTPRAYWRMSDLSDSGPEGDHTLTLSGSPTTDEPGAWTSDLAVLFNGSSQYATAADGAADLDITGDLTIIAWINPDDSGTVRTVVARNNGGDDTTYQLFIDTDDSLAFFQGTTGAVTIFANGTVPPDTWSMVAVVRSGASLSMFIDGVRLGTAASWSSIATSVPSDETRIASHQAYGDYFDGHISEVAIWDRALTAGEIAGLYGTQSNRYGSERTDQRIATLASDAGVPATSLSTGQSTMAAWEGSGSYLDVMREAATTEAGNLFIAGDGTLTFRDRHYRLLTNPTPDAVVGDSGDTSFQDVVAGLYSANVYNDIRVTPSSGYPAIATDTTSVAKYGQRTRQVTIYPADTGDALHHANYLLAQSKDTAMRVAQITFVLGSDAAAWPIVLGAELGDRFTVVKEMPGDDIVQDVYLEKVDFKVAPMSWVVTWDLSPADVQTAFWVLDSATRSQLDSTTILNY